MAKKKAEFDIVVYGASGFTGRLVAEYLGKRGIKNWAMAGRSLEKLAEVRDAIGAAKDIPLIAADSDDSLALKAMCERARVIITTVGPYQLYGPKLVAACAETGTDYVDLCGEPAWMREMIDAHDETAKKSGARIVFSCGFDSIPFDLGVWYLQQEAVKKFGKPAPLRKGPDAQDARRCLWRHNRQPHRNDEGGGEEPQDHRPAQKLVRADAGL